MRVGLRLGVVTVKVICLLGVGMLVEGVCSWLSWSLFDGVLQLVYRLIEGGEK